MSVGVVPFRVAVAFGVAAMLSPLPAAPLDAGGRRPVFTVATDLVHLTVTVSDREGNLVGNLAPEDFTVLEDGKPQKVQLFGRALAPGQEETLALDLGMIFDTSGSMLKELRLSQEAAVRFLDAIPRARDLLTIFFDQDIRISRYDSENQQGLFERILEARGEGQTALYDAVAAYISRVGDGPGRKVLVIFTDGDDNRSTLGRGELLDLVRGSPVTIYPVAFLGSLPQGGSQTLLAKGILEHLAAASGGRVFSPVSSRDLPGIYDRILSELSAQYVLGYAPDVSRRDGRFRKLKVTIDRPGLKIRCRSGYYAPAS